MAREIIIGTRGSPLALWQASWVKERLEKKHPGLTCTLKKIKTSGDKITDVPLAMVGGKGLFVKEIEENLLVSEIDLAIHSMKDVPTRIPEGLHLPTVTRREDPRDVLISRSGKPLRGLSAGSRLGTSSLRRMAQLLEHRPDLEFLPLRGNLDTRLRKLKSGGLDAIVVAAAGMRRMGWEGEITEYLDPEICLPAIGQGAIGIECRKGDGAIETLIDPLNDLSTKVAVTAERAVLRRLEGGCQVPIGAHAVFSSGILRLRGLVASLDGKRILRAEESGPPEEAESIGERLAQRLLDKGAGEILEAIYHGG
jgi:hydroxymethylbilane synthase